MGAAGAPNVLSLAFLPLVGAVTGLASGAIAEVSAQVLPHAIVVALAFALSVLFTGAIHLDGLMDASDALFAEVSPERRREIMKDAGRGAFAIVACTIAVVFWVAALWEIPPALYPVTFALSAAVARWAMTLNALFTPYARGGTIDEDSRAPAWPAIAWTIALAVALYFSGLHQAIFMLGGAAVVALAIGWWASRRLSGVLTGDVYGFGITIVEVLLLCFFAAVV